MSATPFSSLTAQHEAPLAGTHEPRSGAHHPAYRPDIDGLRAVAVGSVVMYHAFPATIRGGFIGVDVFFVISGFLISTILFGNLAGERFSFVDFYVRRIRRIFPALLAMMIATFAFGWFALLDDEYMQLGKHLAAGAGFVSNLVFWQESGYFDTAGEAKPFLHLWSLGIEEQFYIVWPILLWVVWRLRWSPLVVLPVVALVSFGVNLQSTATDSVAAFYSPVSRCWELAVGSLLAYRTVFPSRLADYPSQRQRDQRSWLGAALLVAGFVAINATSAFPGWWAVLPTGGALLLLAAGPHAWVNRHVLSNRVMVWVGLISFPLYLWHWPILSMLRILAYERPTRAVRVVAIVAAFILAWITYRFVEKPIRERSRSRVTPMLLLAAMALAGSVGIICASNDGFGFRSVARSEIVHPGDLGQDAFYAYSNAHFAPCEPQALRDDAERWDSMVRCLQSRPGPADLAIIGDSHAEHLFAGMAEALPSRNVVFYTRSSAPVTANPAFDKIFAYVVNDRRIKTVVLSAWWSLRLTQLPRDATAAAALHSTIATLVAAGKAVYLADDVPNFSFSPRLCKYAGSRLRFHRCVDDAAFFGKQIEKYESLFDSLALNEPHLTILRMSPYFCHAQECSMVADGKLAFRDSDHMSIEGSNYLGRRLVEAYPALSTP